MPFELLPYTNFHDLNLDWIMSQFPKVYEARDEAEAAAAGMEAIKDAAEDARDAAQTAQGLAEAAQLAAEAAQGYAEDAASRAAQSVEDAGDIVEHALDDIGTGTAGAVADWLSENVDPSTGYVVDKSLTISGAAADARATGLSVGGLRDFWKEVYTVLEWEQGDINLGTGAEETSSTAVRSGFVAIPSTIPVLVTGINDDDSPNPPPEISVAMAVYSSDDVSDFVSSSGPVTENAGFFGEAGYYVRFIVKYTGGGSIDPTATVLNFLTVDIREPTDTNLSLATGTTGNAADSGHVGDAVRALYNAIPLLDDTLSIANRAADAAATGAAIDNAGLSNEAKTALLDCFAHVAWVDEHGQNYYNALAGALNNSTWTITNNLTNCTTSNAATSVQRGGSYSATITASTGYVMTGATVSITMGGNDITATAYSNGAISIQAVTGALVITISAVALTVSSISAIYTQSGNIYEYDSIESLKDDLAVTATYTDETTAIVTDYTLNGTLAEGISTITVTYAGKSTTFNVTVSSTTKAVWNYTLGRLPSSVDGIEKSTSGTYTETFESDGIHASCGSANNDYLRYIPSDSSLKTGTNIISEHEFIISTLANTSANVSAVLSNGTDGCNVIFVNNSDLCYYKGTARTNIMSFSVNTLYKLRIEYQSGVEAKVYLNNNLILTQPHANRSTYYNTASRLGLQNSASVIIKSMKWYVRGA